MNEGAKKIHLDIRTIMNQMGIKSSQEENALKPNESVKAG